MQVAILVVEIQTTEIALLPKGDLLRTTNHHQVKASEVIHTIRWHQGAVVPSMMLIIKEWVHRLIITVDTVITIQETSHKRRISIIANTISLHLAEVINLHLIVGINMKSKSTCLRREKHLLVLWEIMQTIATLTTMVVAMVGTLSSKTTIIINTTTSRAAMREVAVTTRVMEISNNKRTTAIARLQSPPMKMRLTSKLSLHSRSKVEVASVRMRLSSKVKWI
jgi:hypothetical protein